MRTLTHEPLALGGVLLLLVALVACLTVWVTLRISKLRTDRVASATGAAGPDVPRAEASGPGRTRPQGGGRSAGYVRSAEATGTSPGAADTGTKRDFAATQGVTAPEGAPAALSGATPGDWAYGVTVFDHDALPPDDTPEPGVGYCGRPAGWHRFLCTLPRGHSSNVHRAGDGDVIAAEWQDPIAHHIDTAAALLIADDWKPTDRLDVGTEAEWWLAIGAPEGWAPPPVVPGRSES